MNSTDKITKSQKRIINRLVDCEESLSNLYHSCAEKFPDMSLLWRKLSRQERGHANMLKGLLKLVDRGYIIRNLGKLDAVSIDVLQNVIASAREKLENNYLGSREALAIALGCENSIIDAHLYDVAKCDAPEFRLVGSALSRETASHACELEMALKEHCRQVA